MANRRAYSDCGFPLARVLATPHSVAGVSPKAATLCEIKRVAFVDDFLPN
ncbi:hypothetical protein [Noviherbaspirillum sp. ST9]